MTEELRLHFSPFKKIKINNNPGTPTLWSGLYPTAMMLVWARGQQIKLRYATSSLYWLRFTRVRHFSSLCRWWTTRCWSVSNCTCVCVQQPHAKTSIGPSPSVCKCWLPPEPWLSLTARPARCQALIATYISAPCFAKPSSTDAAAELISGESMTKSLWKHFYLCVCLCG